MSLFVLVRLVLLSNKYLFPAIFLNEQVDCIDNIHFLNILPLTAIYLFMYPLSQIVAVEL